MDDLFKQFRDNLESRPDPAFEERDWKDMQAASNATGLNGLVSLAGGGWQCRSCY